MNISSGWLLAASVFGTENGEGVNKGPLGCRISMKSSPVSLKAKQLRYTLFCNILLCRHDFRYCLTMRCLLIVDVSNLICTNFIFLVQAHTVLKYRRFDLGKIERLILSGIMKVFNNAGALIVIKVLGVPS